LYENRINPKPVLTAINIGSQKPVLEEDEAFYLILYNSVFSTK